jgi:hypothetical protein
VATAIGTVDNRNARGSRRTKNAGQPRRIDFVKVSLLAVSGQLSSARQFLVRRRRRASLSSVDRRVSAVDR